MAKRMQLVMWQRGDYAVAVVLNGTDLTIERKLDEVVEETLALPASRSLLLSLREACEQALRVMP